MIHVASPVYVTWVDRSEDPAPALVNTVRILHPIFSLSLRCFTLIHMQVFKGIKNGVQEVAVKVLINSDEIQVQMFQEVRPSPSIPQLKCSQSHAAWHQIKMCSTSREGLCKRHACLCSTSI